MWVARSATNRSASSVERCFGRRGRLSALVISPRSCGEVTKSSRPSSAASRIRTEGASGERTSAAEISTFASADLREQRAEVAGADRAVDDLALHAGRASDGRCAYAYCSASVSPLALPTAMHGPACMHDTAASELLVDPA